MSQQSLKMGEIEQQAVYYADGTVAHRMRKDGRPEFDLGELKSIILCWNSHNDLLAACKEMERNWWMIGNRITLAGSLPKQMEQVRERAKAAIKLCK